MILVEGSANLAVLALKTFTGLATGSMAILGDALHSLTDVANNAVAWFVVRLSTKPADPGHPYGHRKFETIAVFGLAMLLTVMAFQLGARALGRGEAVVHHAPWALGLMLVVLGVNLWLSLWQGAWARRLGSDILRADARHTFADVLTTIVVIVGWQAGARGALWIDTAAALAVAVLILFLAYGLFRRSIPVLVDSASLDPAEVVEACREVPGVLGVRSVRSRTYGPEAAVDLVVAVAPDLSTAASHEIATGVERAVAARLPVQSVTVHVEPAAVPRATHERP